MNSVYNNIKKQCFGCEICAGGGMSLLSNHNG